MQQLSDVDCDKSTVTWAPDSKSLLWSGSDHQLRRTFIADERTEVVATSEVGDIGTPQFSPDGAWISYTKPDAMVRPRVWVKQLESGEERVIGADDFLISNGAKWTPDGRKLLLLGGTGAPGRGLRTARERLKLACGENASLELRPQGGWVAATIHLPEKI